MQADDPYPRGAASAFERIRHGVRIMALKRLSDPAAAEEAAQETMVRLLEAIERLDDAPPDLGAYARGIAAHVIADHHRSGPRQISLESPQARERLRSPEGKDPLIALITDEQRRRLRDALSRLDDPDRELLRLCFFEGQTPREIAARNGEPAARIRKRKSRALERLRRVFHGHDVPLGETSS